MKILGIETSCDETGLAVIEAEDGLTKPRFKVLKNIVASQIKIHRPFGGVVPNLAKREHLKNLPILFKKLFAKEPKSLRAIELIAVTVGPGLEPALWTGINFAEDLAKTTGIPLVGANHLEGHLYSFLLPHDGDSGFRPAKRGFRRNDRSGIFPAVALIVSGGHTILLKMESFSKWRRLGETRDDAAGEAFDKVARLLKLPYPGGPEIEKLARKGNPAAIDFPRPMLRDKNFDFSFSGLKTAALYYVRDNPDADTADIAASFQQAATDVLVAKTMRAARESGARSVLLSGGVAANKHLRAELGKAAKKIGLNFFVPDFKYNLDNAVMIAAAGYFAHLRKKKYKMEAQGNLEI